MPNVTKAKRLLRAHHESWTGGKNFQEDRTIWKDSLLNWSLGGFAGVYDGHGGTFCCDYLKKHLHDFFDASYRKRINNPQNMVRMFYLSKV